MKIIQFDKMSSVSLKVAIKVITLSIFGLLIKLMIFALLSLAIFGRFDTFPGGEWVVKTENKDHLSPAEAKIGAELGKKIIFKVLLQKPSEKLF